MKKHLILLTIILNTFLITASLNAQMGSLETDASYFVKAIKNNQVNKLKQLLKNIPEAINEVKSYKGATLLMLAVCNNVSTEIIQLLLDAQANPDIINDDGNTSLHLAIKHFNDDPDNYYKILQLILPKSNMYALNGKHRSPLELLNFRNPRGFQRIIRLFIKHGYDLNHPLHKGLPLSYYFLLEVRVENRALIEWFLQLKQKKIDYTRYDKEVLETLIKESYFSLLLPTVKNINKKDKQGQTVLFYYSRGHYLGPYGLNLAKKNGADFQLQDKQGRNLLHHYCMSFNNYSKPEPKIIDFLIESGVNLSQQDDQGNTPLHYLPKTEEVYKTILPYLQRKAAKIPNADGITVDEMFRKKVLEEQTRKKRKIEKSKKDQWDFGLKIGLGSNFRSGDPSFTLGVFHYAFFDYFPFGMRNDIAYNSFYIDENQSTHYELLNWSPSFIWNFTDRFYLGTGFYVGLPLNSQSIFDAGFSASLGYMNNYVGIDITYQQGLIKDFIKRHNKSLLVSVQLDNHFLIPISLVGLPVYGLYKKPVVGITAGGLILLVYFCSALAGKSFN